MIFDPRVETCAIRELAEWLESTLYEVSARVERTRTQTVDLAAVFGDIAMALSIQIMKLRDHANFIGRKHE